MTLQYKRIAGVEEKLQGHQFGLDIAFADDLLVNESEMSLWVPFASGVRRDGVGDLLEIGGIDTSRHIKNPVVLFDHGKAVQLPVGMSEDPDTKQYRVVLDPVAKVAKGKAYFYQGSKDMEGVGAGQVYEHALFCEQLFDLVVKRFIRAGSIGYQVKTARRLPADFNTGTPEGLHLLSVLMLEFSVVVMPANADTVGKVLSLDRICGKKLSHYLVKSLAPYAPARKVMMGYQGKAKNLQVNVGTKSIDADYHNLVESLKDDPKAIHPLKDFAEDNPHHPKAQMINHLHPYVTNPTKVEEDNDEGMPSRHYHGDNDEHAEQLRGRSAYNVLTDQPIRKGDKVVRNWGNDRHDDPRFVHGVVTRTSWYNDQPDEDGRGGPYHHRVHMQHGHVPHYDDTFREPEFETESGGPHHRHEADHYLREKHPKLYDKPSRTGDFGVTPVEIETEQNNSKSLIRNQREEVKGGKKPTYRDVGAVPRAGFYGPPDDQADLDQPFDTPSGLYSESRYVPDTQGDRQNQWNPNTAAGYFASTGQSNDSLNQNRRLRANDVATGRNDFINSEPLETETDEEKNLPRQRQKSQERIPGGLASGKKPSSFDPAQLKAGMKVEMEHTDDPRLAREIAMDHLTEDPAYYQKLSRMEGKSVKAWSSHSEILNRDTVSQGPDYEKYRDDIYNNPLHIRLTSQHGVGDGPDAVRPRMTGEDRERQQRASQIMDEITDRDTGIDVERIHLRERQEAQRNKQLPRQGRKANRNPALRRDFDDTELVQQMDQEQPGYSDNAEMVRSENANYIHGPRRERNRQRAIERADAANARDLESGKSIKALRKLYGSKSQPSDAVSKEKARQILKNGEVHGHPLTEKQRRMFGAAAGKGLGKKAVPDNDHDTPKTDLQRRIRETEAMRAGGSPLVEEGRVDPREHRRMMINPSISKPAMPTSHQQVNIGVTGMAIGGGVGSGITILEHMLKSKSLRIKSLRRLYGNKMAKRKGESKEDYADRMNREEVNNAVEQYDQRINDYYNAAMQAPNGPNPTVTQHFDSEVQAGTRDLGRAEDARERNYDRRLRGGKAYTFDQNIEGAYMPRRVQEDGTVEEARGEIANDPKTPYGARAKRSRVRMGPHTGHAYEREREPATAQLPDLAGITDEWNARNDIAHENQPSREELENEYQARRERYYEDRKSFPGEQLPVPHGAEIYRNTIPPAHRDFRVISSKSAEGEDDLPDFYKPKQQEQEQPKPRSREDRIAAWNRVYRNLGSSTVFHHPGNADEPTLGHYIENRDISNGTPPEKRDYYLMDMQNRANRYRGMRDQGIGHQEARNRVHDELEIRDKGMKVRNWDEYEQHQERLDNESLQAQRDPNVTDEQNAEIQDRVGREYERLHGYSDKINRRQRRIDQRSQQEEKGLDLFSGATHNKIGKYTDRAFHSFETGQISEEELRKRLAQAARVRAEMDKARGQFMREKDDRLDQYNRQAVAGKSVEPEDDLPDFYKPKEGTPLPEPTPQQAHLQAYRDIENARRAINREQKEDTVDADWGRRASQRLTRRNITRSALNARTAGNISGAYEHLNRLPSKEDTLLPPEKSLKGRIKALREMYGKAASGKRPTRQQVGLGGDPEELAPTSPSIVIGQTPIDNPNPNSMAGALRIGQNEASREIEEGRHGLDPQAFEDRRKRESKISRMLRGTYDPEDDEDIEEGARIQEEMRGQHTRPHPLVDRPVKDGKSMGSDQEEVANKPLKDGVLPGLKRNKRSVNGDALLYVEEKDIPDVRKKADELGLKIHRITGNTPGYVRMRFQGNDDDIDTVARVFGRLADTKE